MKQNILVAGGCGYIGSHTCVELIEAGYKVTVVDNLSNSSADSIKGIEKITGKSVEFIEADCCDVEKMDHIFATHNFAAVIDFAAFKAVGESVNIPLDYYKNNIFSVINFMELMMKHKVENFLFSSSCTVYGQAEQLPVNESTPRMEATSPYGNTKRINEDIIRDCVNAYKNIKGIALRYFNPIGAHPSGEIGEMPQGIPNNLLPYVTQTAAGIRECLSIYGDDYDTPDGFCIRDYIDVVDLAKAHVLAIKRMIEGKMKSDFEIFGLGTGRGVSTMEIVKAFEKANNLKLNYKIVGRREGDIEAIWADPTIANKELGWKAERTLEQTLQSAWNWEKKVRNIK